LEYELKIEQMRKWAERRSLLRLNLKTQERTYNPTASSEDHFSKKTMLLYEDNSRRQRIKQRISLEQCLTKYTTGPTICLPATSFELAALSSDSSRAQEYSKNQNRLEIMVLLSQLVVDPSPKKKSGTLGQKKISYESYVRAQHFHHSFFNRLDAIPKWIQISSVILASLALGYLLLQKYEQRNNFQNYEIFNENVLIQE